MSARLLLVEDDARIAGFLRRGLEDQGFTVDVARTCAAALQQFAIAPPDMVLLDLGLPDGDGLKLLPKLRELRARLPVIAVTARDGIEQRVAGLEAGADDYLVKPYAFPELLARIRALLRRSESDPKTELRVADLVIDLTGRRVARGGQPLDLTPREFDLLAYLAQRPSEVVSREMIERDVWRVTNRMTSLDNVIDVHITHLREKVDKPFPTRLLRTVRGVGFVLEAAGAA